MDDSYDRMERIHAFRRRNHSLRLSASRIAAMTGFNPYASLPEILMNLVYQGGQELLLHDSQLLGIVMRSEEDILMDLAKKASAPTQKALTTALQVKKGQRVVDTVHSAQKVKEKVLKEAKESKKLSAEEIKVLQEGVRSSVDTGYGTFHEDEALDLYEKQCGEKVRERNSAMLAWPFVKAEDASDIPTVVPISKATALSTNYYTRTDKKPRADANKARADEKDQGREASLYDRGSTKENMYRRTADTRKQAAGEKADSGAQKPTSYEGKPAAAMSQAKSNVARIPHGQPWDSYSGLHQRPFFTIFGTVDGIRDEWWCRSDEAVSTLDEDWQIRKVIVECKHRMKKTLQAPPLYDQIQTTAYCLMNEVTEADIVQVVRKNKEVEKKEQEETVDERKPQANVEQHGATAASDAVQAAELADSGSQTNEKGTITSYFDTLAKAPSGAKKGATTYIEMVVNRDKNTGDSNVDGKQDPDKATVESCTEADTSQTETEYVYSTDYSMEETDSSDARKATSRDNVDSDSHMNASPRKDDESGTHVNGVEKDGGEVTTDTNTKVPPSDVTGIETNGESSMEKKAGDIDRSDINTIHIDKKQKQETDETDSSTSDVESSEYDDSDMGAASQASLRDSMEVEAHANAPSREKRGNGTHSTVDATTIVNKSNGEASSTDAKATSMANDSDHVKENVELHYKDSIPQESSEKELAVSASTAGKVTRTTVNGSEKKKADRVTVEISVKRVSLEDPVMNHKMHWHAIILPRLRSFVDAVYRIRATDDKRYRLLHGMSDSSGNYTEAWKLLHEECPWLLDCDTAFQARVARSNNSTFGNR